MLEVPDQDSIIKHYLSEEWGIEGWYFTPESGAHNFLNKNESGGGSTQYVLDEADADKAWEMRLTQKQSFWQNYLATSSSSKSVRIEGQHYWLGSATISTPFNGFSGSWFNIEFHDGRKTRTCDLWHQGIIPQALRSILTDNAVFTD